jgi:hypothetical protein
MWCIGSPGSQLIDNFLWIDEIGGGEAVPMLFSLQADRIKVLKSHQLSENSIEVFPHQ